MELNHPTLLLDSKRCKENIKSMATKARSKGLAFKPHFKTHQSKIVGEWFNDEGVEGITVSSIKMAEYFTAAGWQDITIAFPVNIKAVEQLDQLAGQVNLTLLLDTVESAQALTSSLRNKVNILIELDAGSKRSGIRTDNDQEILNVIAVLKKADQLQWKGFYSHFGHTYSCRGEAEIKKVFGDSLQLINNLISRNEWKEVDLHIGDTPGCSMAEAFAGVTAITPGNFVFYDVMQWQIGACSEQNIGIAMACPVVSKKPERKEIIIHGGAVHFSKDSIRIGEDPHFGIMAALSEDGISTVFKEHKVTALSQEHGLIKIQDPDLFNQINIGNVVGILPIHSCLTAECMGSYLDFSGNKIDHL